MHCAHHLAAPYEEPPANVNLSDVHPGTLIFSWMSVNPSCSLVRYEITSHNCGTCSVSMDTTATCSDLHLSTNTTVCTFSVRSMVCGYTGSSSSQTVVNLKGLYRFTELIESVILELMSFPVPETPEVNLTPVYSNDNQSLTKVTATISQAVSL